MTDTTDLAFDPMNLDDIDFDVYEDPETGATTYDKPEPTEPVVEDEWTPPEEEPQDATELFDSFSEDALLDFGEYGKLDKKTILETVRKKEQIDTEHQFINELAGNLKQAQNHSKFILQRHTTELDKRITAEQYAMQNSTDYAERGRHQFELDKLLNMKKEVDADVQRLNDVHNAQQQELLGQRIRTTDAAMMAKYGNQWAKDAQDVYRYAVGSGMDAEDIKSVLSPALVEMIVKARLFDASKAKAKAKADDAIQATIARSKRPHQPHARTEEPNSRQREALQQRMAKGNLTKAELASAFNMVEF